MTSFDELLSNVPIGQIAQKLGVDEATASSAVQAALPTLLGGLQANATQPEGAASLVGALGKHDGELVSGAGAVDIEQVDVADGAKIVDNVFGAEKNTVISALGATEGTGGNDLVAKLLPILAPIVLAYLAKQMGGGGAAAPQAPAPSSGGGGIGDILGGLLGGSGNSGGIGGAIGEALAKNAGGAIGSVLGGLLGGKR
ncbi:DUF937 domain-containing protein [Nocardia puris]|uniref:Uncharacterized protein DUF937 n=1 Tax=Nocardia puris TaxID=208602 RepID=A0A366DCG6_9NOCA|nr:DUF937 domain-containing protein [Nocardia puris]MBF6211770.1 DUF937 domain-containing protein [Nocardia puris]MBF6365773.1 DUF937 domain-containing protein [Nocardia puris]MBF6460584.1 DUF937 domain-containing protein [Nocardia puris]RBO86948.1 uncharacterized protein DUF937 [Nocardia puris]